VGFYCQLLYFCVCVREKEKSEEFMAFLLRERGSSALCPWFGVVWLVFLMMIFIVEFLILCWAFFEDKNEIFCCLI
jgi:hypothetical protein